MQLIHPAIVGLTLRQTLARRRWVLLLVLLLLPLVMVALVRSFSGLDGEGRLGALTGGLTTLILTGIVPVTALLLAHSALGSEVEDGTIIYLLTKPIPRWNIFLSKYLAVALTASAGCGLATLVAVRVLMGGEDSAGLAGGLVIAAVAGGVIYAAIFLTLTLTSRRGLLIGLVYLMIWEGVLGRLFAGTRTFSVRQYLLSLMGAWGQAATEQFEALLPFATAWKMSLLILALTGWICIASLRKFQPGQTG